MNQYYYVDPNNKPAGPYTADQMADLRARGALQDQTLVAREGDPSWRTWADFFGAPAQAAAGAPAAPAPAPASAPAPAARPQPAPAPSPAEAEVPPSVRVFGVLNIIFGGLGLLCSPFSLLGVAGVQGNPLLSHTGVFYHGWTVFAAILGIVGAAVMLVSGIWLYRYADWARKLAVGYAWFSIALGLAGIAVNLFALAPLMGEAEWPLAIGLIAGTVGGLVGLVYPVLLIVFLSRARTREALVRYRDSRRA